MDQCRSASRHEWSPPARPASIRIVDEGATNQEIALQRYISVTTGQTHRAHIVEKLNLHHRTMLVRYAIRKRLIEPWCPAAA